MGEELDKNINVMKEQLQVLHTVKTQVETYQNVYQILQGKGVPMKKGAKEVMKEVLGLKPSTDIGLIMKFLNNSLISDEVREKLTTMSPIRQVVEVASIIYNDSNLVKTEKEKLLNIVLGDDTFIKSQGDGAVVTLPIIASDKTNNTTLFFSKLKDAAHSLNTITNSKLSGPKKPNQLIPDDIVTKLEKQDANVEIAFKKLLQNPDSFALSDIENDPVMRQLNDVLPFSKILNIKKDIEKYHEALTFEATKNLNNLEWKGLREAEYFKEVEENPLDVDIEKLYEDTKKTLTKLITQSKVNTKLLGAVDETKTTEITENINSVFERRAERTNTDEEGKCKPCDNTNIHVQRAKQVFMKDLMNTQVVDDALDEMQRFAKKLPVLNERIMGEYTTEFKGIVNQLNLALDKVGLEQIKKAVNEVGTQDAKTKGESLSSDVTDIHVDKSVIEASEKIAHQVKRLYKQFLGTVRKGARKYYLAHVEFIVRKLRKNARYIRQWRETIELRKQAKAIHVQSHCDEYPDLTEEQLKTTPGKDDKEKKLNYYAYKDYDDVIKKVDEKYVDAIKNLKQSIEDFYGDTSKGAGKGDDQQRGFLGSVQKSSEELSSFLRYIPEIEEQERLKDNITKTLEYIDGLENKLYSMYNNKYSIMDIIFDSKFLAIYVLKLVHLGIIVGSLFLTEKLFSEMYMKAVYGENKNPPHIFTLLFIFVAINIGFLMFLLTILFLVMFVFKTPANDFIINADLLKTFAVDVLIFLVILIVLCLIIGHIIQQKKYFRYKTEGLRAARAYIEIIIGLAGILTIVPFFAIM
jgi:hypothetical protein